MKKFKIINLETWEVTPVLAYNKPDAIRQFTIIKCLKRFNDRVYKVFNPNSKERKYSNKSLGQFENNLHTLNIVYK